MMFCRLGSSVYTDKFQSCSFIAFDNITFKNMQHFIRSFRWVMYRKFFVCMCVQIFRPVSLIVLCRRYRNGLRDKRWDEEKAELTRVEHDSIWVIRINKTLS